MKKTKIPAIILTILIISIPAVFAQETNTQTQPQTIQPIPVEIKTDLKNSEGAYLASTKTLTQIIATFENAGTGFAKHKNVYLDLTEINKQSKVQATDCSQQAEKWQCIWNVQATTPTGPKTIKLLEESQNDNGIPITTELTQDIDVTDTTLTILDAQHTPKYPTETDTLTITTSLPAEASQPTVTIDTSQITQNQQETKTNCEKEENTLTCTAHVKNLKATSEPKTITIIAADSRGEIQETTLQIQIYQTETKTENKFRFAGITISPANGIDRKTATIIEYPLFATPRWLPTSSENLQIITQTIKCEEKYLATPPQITGKETKNPAIFLKITTDIAGIKENQIQIPCTMSITIRQDNTIYKEPETKDFTLTIPLYNNPLGEIDTAIQKKINETETEIKKFDSKIKDFQQINNALGKLAGISQTIAQMDAMMSAATAIVYTASLIWFAIDPVDAQVFWKAYYDTYNPYNFAMKSFIWSPGPLPIFSNAILKLNAYVYTCQMCRHTGKIDVPILDTAGDIIAHIDMEEAIRGKTTSIQKKILKEWDPKKSIHVAQNCFCPNAIEYNLQKEKQLKCIYKRCIQEHAKKGLPITNCDKTFKEQNCLYIDSASWKLAGGAQFAQLMQRLAGNIIKELPLLTIGAAWQSQCDPLIGALNTIVYTQGYLIIPNGLFVPMCGVWAAALQLAETDFFTTNQFDWDLRDAELKGHDYCTSED